MADQPSQSTAAEAGDFDNYRAPSAMAIVALAFGMLSVLALWHPLLWVVPFCAVLLSLVALRRIARNPDSLFGRRAALMGLGIALIVGTAASTGYAARQWQSRSAARQFAFQWFQALRERRPQWALQLYLDPGSRKDNDDAKLWENYNHDPDGEKHLRSFVDQPVVRALLALGERAHVRYWGTDQYTATDTRERIGALYCVTYAEQDQTKSFFVAITLDRALHGQDGASGWRISRVTFATPPEELTALAKAN